MILIAWEFGGQRERRGVAYNGHPLISGGWRDDYTLMTLGRLLDFRTRRS